ncbi:hypothetical protein [Micromonospora costi]|nr:hypothetical protein [Micromonospora costi]
MTRRKPTSNEFAIRRDAFHHQFATDVSPAQAAVLSAEAVDAVAA